MPGIRTSSDSHLVSSRTSKLTAITALDAMDKLKSKLKSLMGSKKSHPSETNGAKPAATPTTTPTAPVDTTPTPTTTAPQPAPPATAVVPSTSEPPAGKSRLRRLSDKTTLVDLFSPPIGVAEGVAEQKVGSKGKEPASPAPGAVPTAAATAGTV